MNYNESLEYAFFYDLPAWTVALALPLIMLVAVEIGYGLGVSRRVRRGLKDADRGGGAIVLTSLFAVMGLLLAFSYSAAVERHDNRRQALLQEANALGTAFLRADVLGEPHRTELKQALYDYALTRRIDPDIDTQAERQQGFADSLAAQERIWPITREAVAAEPRAPIAFGVLAAINEVLDQHLVRLDMGTNKLPAPVIVLLMIIAAMSLTLAGFVAGVQAHIGRWRLYGFALVLSTLIVIIIDFDRPTDGLIRVHGASIEATIADMRASMAPEP